MDNNLFLEQLRELSLEEGKAYIREHAAEIEDHGAFGNLLADEARRLLYTPFVSLKLAEVLIFFGEYISYLSSHALGLNVKVDDLIYIVLYKSFIEVYVVS